MMSKLSERNETGGTAPTHIIYTIRIKVPVEYAGEIGEVIEQARGIGECTIINVQGEVAPND